MSIRVFSALFTPSFMPVRIARGIPVYGGVSVHGFREDSEDRLRPVYKLMAKHTLAKQLIAGVLGNSGNSRVSDTSFRGDGIKTLRNFVASGHSATPYFSRTSCSMALGEVNTPVPWSPKAFIRAQE